MTTRRSRQPNVDGGRQHRHEVKLSDEQEVVLAALAADRGLTISRFLVDSALPSGRARSVLPTEVVTELYSIGNHLGAIGRNVNQIARIANSTDDVTRDAAATFAAVRRAAYRISGLIDSTLATVE